MTGTSAPCTSLFKPVSVDSPVELGPVPANTFDERTLWWRHEQLHRLVMRNPAALLGRYRVERDATEAEWVREPPASSECFSAATQLECEWFDKISEAVRAGAAPQCLPRRVVKMWQRWDRAAQIPELAALRS